MDAKELNDRTYEITDLLEQMANVEYMKATAYRDGYVKACEDFGRELRARALMEQTDASTPG